MVLVAPQGLSRVLTKAACSWLAKTATCLLQKKKRDDAEGNGAAAEPEQKKKKRKAADTVADTADTLAAIAAAPLPVQVCRLATLSRQTSLCTVHCACPLCFTKEGGKPSGVSLWQEYAH